MLYATSLFPLSQGNHMGKTNTNPISESASDSETLYILQNADLMRQIAASVQTQQQSQGYQPTTEQINQILNP